MECSICGRSVFPEHLVDGDFCIDCWDTDYCKKCGAKMVLPLEHLSICKGEKE